MKITELRWPQAEETAEGIWDFMGWAYDKAAKKCASEGRFEMLGQRRRAERGLGKRIRTDNGVMHTYMWR